MASKIHLSFLIVAISLALAGSIAVTGVLQTSTTIGSSGTVKAINVEVYWDEACTQNVTEIDWGTLEPGSSIQETY